MQRTPAAEVFTVPLYVILGVVILGIASLIIPALSMAQMGGLQAMLFSAAVIFVPAVLVSLPAYGASVTLRRKGMGLAIGCAVFFALALLGIILFLGTFSPINGDTFLGATLIAAILTALFAGLEYRRPKLAQG